MKEFKQVCERVGIALFALLQASPNTRATERANSANPTLWANSIGQMRAELQKAFHK